MEPCIEVHLLRHKNKSTTVQKSVLQLECLKLRSLNHKTVSPAHLVLHDNNNNNNMESHPQQLPIINSMLHTANTLAVPPTMACAAFPFNSTTPPTPKTKLPQSKTSSTAHCQTSATSCCANITNPPHTSVPSYHANSYCTVTATTLIVPLTELCSHSTMLSALKSQFLAMPQAPQHTIKP